MLRKKSMNDSSEDEKNILPDEHPDSEDSEHSDSEDSEQSDSEDSEHSDIESKSKDNFLPLDIMRIISTFTTLKDNVNMFGINKSMSLMKHVVNIDLSDTSLDINKLIKYSKNLSKYKIIGLNIVINKIKPNFMLPDNINTLFDKVTNLTLKVFGNSPFHITLVDSILEKTPNLISFSYDGNLDNTIADTIRRLTKLDSLFIKGKRLGELDNLPNVIKLEVSNTNKLNLQGLTRLKYLKLDHIIRIKNLHQCSSLETLICREQNLESLYLKELPNLEELNLDNVHLKSPLEGLENNQSLQKLLLNGVDNISEIELGICPKLEELKIFKGEVDEEIKLGSLLKCHKLAILNLSSVKITSFSKSLKSIIINEDNNSNDIDLDLNLFTICSKLELLDNEVMQDYDDLMFLSNCTNLKTLSLESENCHSLNGLNYLTKLENLNLFNFGFISDISSIAGCTNLRRLKIHIMDKNLHYLANCTNLISLQVEQALGSLSGLNKCSNLIELRLSKSKVGDMSELKGCTKIKFLEIENMEKLTSLSGIEHCTNLISIEIRNCPKLKYIDSLQQCPSLLMFESGGSPKIDFSSLRKCSSLIKVDAEDIDRKYLNSLLSLPQLVTINGI